MADDWEQEDWEKEDFTPVLPGGPVAAVAAAAADKPAAEPAFEDEDAEPEPASAKEHSIKPQPKKKVEKKYTKGEVVEEPLDDPVAEKLRRQRLEEEADFRAARDLFDGASGGKSIDDLLPKTLKDFEHYAEQLAGRYVLPHAANKNYKGLLKAVIRLAMEPLSVDEAKEVETAVAGVRAEKVKAQQAAQAAKKGGNKKTLNVGKSLSAGLDDYVYQTAAAPDDDYDFM
ncbi:eukaryotic translation initiation factor 3 subunit J-like protein [Raphidocelis subcapitata]|uniref:Eukaryotic translation initiation factor 3 subunit J-like protein n=1 Tax=Raphidocelis subcapitata TaxID=307507 RepID=A0A2V0NM35_9CHLO|nr:eukaryotic translation initiation factor 3 subunit J-like protein [Raphidocelis subcapitata]|eukprot:GBF87442.1 eukaryotic translation initiation factor 3 subunit J-like protein [Raphidocelis subcapitata]